MQSSQNSQHVVGRKVGEVRLGDRVMDFPTYTTVHTQPCVPVICTLFAQMMMIIP